MLQFSLINIVVTLIPADKEHERDDFGTGIRVVRDRKLSINVLLWGCWTANASG